MPISTKEMLRLHGKVALFDPCDCKMKFRCLILDSQQRFGRTEVLLKPMDGTGEGWHDLKRVEVLEGEGSSQ